MKFKWSTVLTSSKQRTPRVRKCSLIYRSISDLDWKNGSRILFLWGEKVKRDMDYSVLKLLSSFCTQLANHNCFSVATVTRSSRQKLGGSLLLIKFQTVEVPPVYDFREQSFSVSEKAVVDSKKGLLWHIPGAVCSWEKYYFLLALQLPVSVFQPVEWPCRILLSEWE